MLSSTVTKALQFAVLAALSVTVSTTLTGPTSEQSKSVCESTIEAIPQASVEPVSTCSAVVLPSPFPSKTTVRS